MRAPQGRCGPAEDKRMRRADIAAKIQRRSGKKRQRNEAHSERWRDRETERFVCVEKVERTMAAMVVS